MGVSYWIYYLLVIFEIDYTPILSKLKEGKLQWFDHIKRSQMFVPIKRVERLVLSGSKGVEDQDEIEMN